MEAHRIVIVGGGAGGLELATLIGRRLGRHGLARVTLVDRERRHFWKPHLHEIAAGCMDIELAATSYMGHAVLHGYEDRIGELVGIDRSRKCVKLAPHMDDDGVPVTPEREIPYDTLVLALGGTTNDFGTAGVREHAQVLDSAKDAQRFHKRFVNACIRVHSHVSLSHAGEGQIVIVGAGATGVELAAELRHSSTDLARYGLERLARDRPIGIHLVEAGPRILPALPPDVVETAMKHLQALDIGVYVGARVAEVKETGVQLADGRFIEASLVVWAAGVKGPEVVTRLDDLAVNKAQQLVVTNTLQTTGDPSIFAIGDCAACPWFEGSSKFVPPRAQAAHQQAVHLAKNLERLIEGKSLRTWRYRDYGSLVSLGRYQSVGQLMSGLSGAKLGMRGWIAWLMYRWLYQSHQIVLHGVWQAMLNVLAQMMTNTGRPRTKLH